ncbi:hypothetical protein PVK06_047580 [Gossypium arboreum]|uniref:Uncharacterized protein n=1 Tax=Gossypium arboreum TaxID=29729 RepID=A0ABR0ME69_GOSAR|nr:hypothetical protein PVK06_047580 [Gossypium arboreum]
MKQTTATRRAASVFHRTVARDPFSIEESTTEDRARRDIERLEWTVRGKGRPLTINRRSISHRRPDIVLFEILIQVRVLPQSD